MITDLQHAMYWIVTNKTVNRRFNAMECTEYTGLFNHSGGLPHAIQREVSEVFVGMRKTARVFLLYIYILSYYIFIMLSALR